MSMGCWVIAKPVVGIMSHMVFACPISVLTGQEEEVGLLLPSPHVYV